MIIETKYPVGGLNVDDAYTVMPTEDYQNAENIRVVVGEDGKMGAIQNVPGNVLVSGGITGTVIGSIEDKEKGRCYFFVNGPTEEGIFCYRYKENDIKTILLGSDVPPFSPNTTLGFLDENRITGIAIVGDILYWTDNNLPPRKINVERALATYDGTFDADPYILPIQSHEITIIVPQPILPLEVEKLVSADDPDIPDQQNNFVGEEAFQFSHRYIFNDNEISALSVYSTLVNYNDDDDDTEYDTIKVTIPAFQEIPNEVRKIQILYRNGNTGSWSIIKELSPSEHSIIAPFSFYFFNEKNGTQISDEIAYKLFDNVPIKSKALEAARNRIFLGNNTFGYGPIESLDITTVIDEIVVGGTPESGTYWYARFFTYNPSNKNQNVSKEIIFVVISGGVNDGIYTLEEVTVNNTTGISVPETYLPNSFQADFNAGNLSDIATTSTSARLGPSTLTDLEITNIVFDRPPGWGWRSSYDTTYTGTSPAIYGLTGTPVENGYRQWKRGSKYRFGIVFYDRWGRNNGVYTNDDMIITTPDRIYTQTIYNGNAVWNITADGDQIPVWATHYQIVRTKNLYINFFLQHFSREPQYVSKDEDGVYVFGTTFDDEATIGLAFDISRIDNDGLGYTFVEGDILKFFASDDSEREILRIIDQQGKYVITEPIDLGDLNDISNEKRVGIVEIYTPDKEDDIFYEVGQVYMVTNAMLYNRNFSTRTGTIPGDIYIKNRGISGEGNLAMECMNINDRHWREWLTDIGRPNVILYDSGQEIRPTNICYSETYVQGTRVNGLSSFNALDQRDLDEQNGPIQKLVLTTRTQEYGSVMLAICSLETSSIYLGERQVLDNADNAILATSGEVIGTINNLKGGYGSINPESVAENEGSVYFWDAINGKVIRYNLNGLTPISDAKMSKFFSELGKAYLATDKTDFFPGGFDQYSGEYLLTIPALSTPTREFLDIEEDTYTKVSRDPLTEFETGVEVAYGDKFTIQATAKLGSLPGLITVFLVNTDGRDPEVAYTTTGVGDEEEYTATKAGSFIITTGYPSTTNITQLKASPHVPFDAKSKTCVFNEDAGRWTDFRTFSAECFGSVPNLLISFKNGSTYRHDNTVRSYFYGTQFKSLMSLVFNENPVPVKTCRIITMQGNLAPYTHVRTEEYNIQSTDILASEYRGREGNLSAAILRDRLSPNVSGSPEAKMISGDTMRGQFPQVSLQWDTSGELTIYVIRFGYTPSSGHRS